MYNCTYSVVVSGSVAAWPYGPPDPTFFTSTLVGEHVKFRFSLVRESVRTRGADAINCTGTYRYMYLL